KHPHKNSRDELELMDGRIVDRYSAPIIDNNEKYYGRVWYFRDVTDRRRAQQTLLASEREQRQLAGELAIERARLVEAQRVAKIGSWESNLDTFEVVWSDEVYRIFEVDPACFVPTHQGVLEKILPEDRLMADDAFSQSLNQAEPVTIEYRIGMADGRVKFVEENWQVIFDKSGKATQAIGTCQDITEHKLNENKIRRLNRVLAVLGQINALIVRVKDRDELFNEACKIATEAGEFHLALIAQLDEDREHVLPVAWAGQDQKLFEVIREALASNGLSKAFSGQAIRERRAIVINHIQDTSNIVSHQHYTESGVHSMAVLPLIVSDEPMGIFALFAHEQEFFHDEEMQLLTELTGDIAFAIDHIEKRERLNYLAYYD
ncbi:MAG: GAF domain-containing protein, partial [Pseudomonadota bacterium]|nr:GAF domain-containing protein [Pseudomonadota bacterium]